VQRSDEILLKVPIKCKMLLFVVLLLHHERPEWQDMAARPLNQVALILLTVLYNGMIKDMG
jgi:hypothetical protein